MKFGRDEIDALRESVKNDPEMSEKRRNHIIAVEKMAVRLGELYLPEELDILRAAALLHDMTKEYSFERQLEVCRTFGYVPTRDELWAPKTFHARTAAMLIPSAFPEFNDRQVISAVRWHTTGHAGMTLSEMLIYLADYIDDSRKFDDCVTLRNEFWDARPEEMDKAARLDHLYDIMIRSYNMTITGLLKSGRPISPDTVYSLNELLCRRLMKQSPSDAG